MNTSGDTKARTEPAGLAVDPLLDPRRLKPIFDRFGRIHLPGFFGGDGAQRVYRNISQDVGWTRAMILDGRPREFPVAAYEALPPDERERIERAVLAEAAGGFQFVYDRYDLTTAIERGERRGWAVEAVYDFLNSPPFLTFIKTMTGDARPTGCNAQVTRYRPGHFLTAHHDDIGGANRLYAYVLNFTPRWRADWGGVLQFLDRDEHVSEGYIPAFNALNVFRVPQAHSVSYVTPFAGVDRLSITGWVTGPR